MAADLRLPRGGLRRCGRRPAARGPDSRPDDPGTDETDTVIRWIDERGEACESTRFAQRSAAPIVLRRFVEPSDSRLWRVLGLLRRGVPQAVVRQATGISPWFLAEMGRNIVLEHDVRTMGSRLAEPGDGEAASLLATAKRAAFADRDLATLAGVGESQVRAARVSLGLAPGYSMVDTCAAEFAAETPYFYSTYASAGSPPEAVPVARPAALVIGSGPVRIGQGIEFDYCAVQAADVLRREGWSAVMVNSNPETVSTDFDASTRLFFEPLDAESVLDIIAFENGPGSTPTPADGPAPIGSPAGSPVRDDPLRITCPGDAASVITDGSGGAGGASAAANPGDAASVITDGSGVAAETPIEGAVRAAAVRAAAAAGRPLPAVVAFGGQTPLNLAGPLVAAGVPLLGSDLEAIDQAEERTRFSALLDRLGIPQPEGGMAESIEEALTLAERIGYPVIVRPSFVIGGLAIDFAYSPDDLARHLAAAAVVDPDRPVRIDRFLEGIEVDIDAVSDGSRVLIPGLLEHVERAGVHSGDSIAVFPPQHVSDGDQALIVTTMQRICLALGAHGLVNAQFIVRDDGVYLIEVNPRASRTVPFLSKVTGVPMVDLAVRISLGATLEDLGWPDGLLAPPPLVAVKAPAFSTAKLKGVDPSVGPFMQSTGEVIGIAEDPRVAMAKALTGASLIPPRAGGGEPPLALLSIADRDKWGLIAMARALVHAGYELAATAGTRAVLEAAGLAAGPVAKLGAAPTGGEAGILDLIAGGRVRLVVNTPTPRSGAVRDAAEIRHAAIADGILCLTAIETGVAAAEALDPELVDLISVVRPITDWVPSGRRAVSVA
jgi:carbamoylphosphate synthase large subunit